MTSKKNIYDSEWEVFHVGGEYYVRLKDKGCFLFRLEDQRTLARYIVKLHNDRIKDEKNRKELEELARLERETDAR